MDQQNRPKTRRRLGWRTAIKFWAILLIGVVVLDRGLWHFELRRIHRFGYEVERRDNPFRWQDNLGNYLLYEPSFELLWRYRPNVRLRLKCRPQFGEEREYDFSANSHGLRDREFAAAKPPGTVRVFCMGDSCTAGYGVPVEHTYAKQLEGLLGQSSGLGRIEVLNAGVEGYTSFQGRQLLKTQLLTFGPDILVVFYSTNDATPKPSSDRDRQRRMSRVGVAVQRALFRSPLCLMLARPVLATKHHLVARLATTRNCQSHPRVDPLAYFENLGEIVRIGRAGGAEVVLLKIPRYTRQSVVPCESADVIDHVAALRQAPLVDVLPAIEARLANGEALYLDSGHPNARGHRVIAEEILKVFVKDARLRKRLVGSSGSRS